LQNYSHFNFIEVLFGDPMICIARSHFQELVYIFTLSDPATGAEKKMMVFIKLLTALE
jgi:hypothetical protein